MSLLVLGACTSPTTQSAPAPTPPSTTSVEAAPTAAPSSVSAPQQSADAAATEPAVTDAVSPAPLPSPVPPSSSAPGGPPTSAAPAPPLPIGQGPAPTAVSIPSIEVDEQLIDLGIAADGTAEVPADYARAGWFAGGGRPGGVGPTVILGHVDSLDGPAVFHRLREVTVGADITVQLADGTQAQYRVSSTAQYAKADFPTFDVYGATPLDTLTLITCGGPFDTDALSYTENVVVTALRV